MDESPTEGGGSFSFERSDLVLFWHRLRATFLVLVIVGALALALTWGPDLGHGFLGLLTHNGPLQIAGIATILLVDAIRRVRQGSTKALVSTLVDVTFITGTLAVTQMSFRLMPFLYLALTAAMLLPLRRAVWVWGYGGLLAALLASGALHGPWIVYSPTATEMAVAARLNAVIFALLCFAEVLMLTGAIHRFSEARHARLAHQMRRKDEFLAGVSHTLRTPLSSIIGYGRIIGEEWSHLLPDEAHESLAILNQQADTMSAMVDNLLVKAQDEIGELALSKQRIDLDQIASDVIGSVAWLYPHKTIHLTGDRQVGAWADPARTRQVIRNLVSNAVGHGGDSIVVNLEAGAAEAMLTVTDDGSGPAPYDGELPLRPLEKCNPTVASPTMGFGLPISLRLARLHGGNLTHRHTPGKVTFTLTLPACHSVPECDKHRQLVVA